MNGPQEKFDQFETNLASAMQRTDPPMDFQVKLMQRISAEERPAARVLGMPTRKRAVQVWAAGLVAAALLIGVSIEHMHHRQERAEATRQFEVATQIEEQALDRTREKLSRSGISIDAQ